MPLMFLDVGSGAILRKESPLPPVELHDFLRYILVTVQGTAFAILVLDKIPVTAIHGISQGTHKMALT